jgi:hypothetical protein
VLSASINLHGNTAHKWTKDKKENIMSMLFIYIFVMMDSIKMGLGLLALVAVICIFISAAATDTSNVEDKRRAKKWLKICVATFLLIGSVAILTPDTKQLAAIYMIPKVVNNEDVRAMSGDAMKTLRIKFNEYLDSIDPVKEVVKAVKPTEE